VKINFYEINTKKKKEKKKGVNIGIQVLDEKDESKDIHLKNKNL
jgi:hypothetical protein